MSECSCDFVQPYVLRRYGYHDPECPRSIESRLKRIEKERDDLKEKLKAALEQIELLGQ